MDDRAVALAAASALTAMACHALVDFPFYIPRACVLYGALLGVLDRRIEGARRDCGAARRAFALVPGRALRSQARDGHPLPETSAAEAAAEWGLHRYAGDHTQSAAFWLESGAAGWSPPTGATTGMRASSGTAQAADIGQARDAARHANEAFAAGVEGQSRSKCTTCWG